MDPDAQAALVDAVIDEGDITTVEFEEEFDPALVAVYGPAPEIWRQFRAWMPWDQDVGAHQDLAAWIIKALIADKSALRGNSRKPVLSPWEVRTAIPSRVWHACIPIDIRAAIDDARMQREREKPGRPFHAADDLAIATPEIIATNVRLRDLKAVFDAAERAMGFTDPAELSSSSQPSMSPVAAQAAPVQPAPLQPAPVQAGGVNPPKSIDAADAAALARAMGAQVAPVQPVGAVKAANDPRAGIAAAQQKQGAMQRNGGAPVTNPAGKPPAPASVTAAATGTPISVKGPAIASMAAVVTERVIVENDVPIDFDDPSDNGSSSEN
jgi:hypothetical protein